MTSTPARQLRWLLILAAMSVMSVAVGANAAKAQTAPPEAGMRVFIDPHTGQFIAPPAAMAGARQPSSAPIRVVPGTSPAGGVVAEIPESLGVETRVSVEPDGSVSTGCRQGPSTER